MELNELSWLKKVMLACSLIARRHAWAVLAISLAMLVVSLAAAASHLDFQTAREDLVSSLDKVHQNQDRYLAEFPAPPDVVIAVKGGEGAQREDFVDLLTLLLEEHRLHFEAIFPYFDLPFLTGRALLFLSPQELHALVDAVTEARPFLLSLSSLEGLTSLLSDFEGNVSGSGHEKLVSMLPFLSEIFGELRCAVVTRGRAEYHSPWGRLLFGDVSPEFAEGKGDLESTRFYHTTANGTIHLLLLRLANQEPETIELMRATVEKARLPFPSLQVGLTGEPLLEHDEMVSSERDSESSGMLSIVLVTIVFALAFRQVGYPLAILASFLLGAGWTLGFTTWAIGHLNLLTVSFFTILVGCGIDFGIHVVMRYEEVLAKTGNVDEAMDSTLVGTGPDVCVSALSNAAAFWAIGMTDFKGVAELGIIAGFGVLLCLLATVLPLPAIIVLLDRHRQPSRHKAASSGRRILVARLESWLLRRALWTVLIVTMLLVASLPRIASVGFDYNLLQLQDQHLESVQTELELIDKGGNEVLFAVSLVDDLEEARRMKARFEALPSVSHVESISDLFPQVTPAKLASLRRLREQLAGVSIPAPEDMELGKGGAEELRRLSEGFMELDRFFQAQRDGLLRNPSQSIRFSTKKLEKEMEKLFSELSELGPGPIEDGLTQFQKNFFRDLSDTISFLKMQDPAPVIAIDDLPENLKLRSVGKNRKLLLRIYARENLWERPALDRFVGEIRKTDPQAVGAPIMIWHHTQSMRSAFENAGRYAVGAVLVILALYFRSLRWMVLALVPLALGVCFMLHAMAVYGIAFNLANFIGLPLLLGVGMDYGIHVLHRAREEKRVNMFDHSTGPATMLSAMTTVAGFGTLAMGRHQGIASLGFILSTGVIGILISALLVLPAILRVWNPFHEPD